MAQVCDPQVHFFVVCARIITTAEPLEALQTLRTTDHTFVDGVRRRAFIIALFNLIGNGNETSM